VIDIPKINKSDKALLTVVIIGIVFSSLAWIGDLASWLYIGNGFTLDAILFVIALAFTFFTFFMANKMKKGEEPTEEIDEDLKELQDIEEAEAKMTEETEFDKILSCSSCGASLTISEENCSSCGSAKPVCVVCLSDLKADDEIVRLTCCSSYAHSEHIDNWISVKGHCPKCHKEIQDNDQNIVYL
jgi:hypothetical protein